MQQSTELDVLFLLYTGNTHALYIPQFEPLQHVVFWLDIQAEDSVVLDMAPDICGSCLCAYGVCVGGRVRFRCHNCRLIAWADRFFIDPWPNRISQLTGLSLEIVEFYTAKALHVHAQVKVNKQMKEHAHERAVVQIQPDVQTHSRADNGKPRRFSFVRS